MAIIKKLVLEGFKSFSKKTVIEFPTEFSVIVGPNGAGKSNIIDALCFVLGTSRSKVIRAQNFAQLIFDGGKKGKPSKYAEVSIHFNNSNKQFSIGSDTLVISRQVFPTGESIYRVNGKRTTRTKICLLYTSDAADE